MREMTVREANQNFSKVIAAAERGGTIVITKNGTPVAKITPQAADRARDPEWLKAFEALAQSLRTKRVTGFRVGRITERDKYTMTPNDPRRIGQQHPDLCGTRTGDARLIKSSE